jgi:hypothetical protein
MYRAAELLAKGRPVAVLPEEECCRRRRRPIFSTFRANISSGWLTPVSWRLGMARGDVLFVIVTLRDEDICRIISARKATRHEQDRYYAGNRETW